MRQTLARATLALAVLAVVAALVPSRASSMTGTKPWVIVLCKFTDLTQVPEPPSYFAQLFSDAGAGQLGLLDWYHDVSYNQLSISGTVIAGNKWYSLGMTRFEWAALNRYDKIQACANQAAGDVNYMNYYGVIAIFNDDSVPGGGTPARTATTTLASNISASDTTITVNSSAGFPATPYGVFIGTCCDSKGNLQNSEELHVTSTSGNSWTVTRAYEGYNNSNDIAHNAGEQIRLIDGGDAGAAAIGQAGIKLGGTPQKLALVVLSWETNVGAAAHESGHGFGFVHSRAISTSTTDYQDCYDNMSFDACRNFGVPLYTFEGTFGLPGQAAAGPGLDAINLDNQGWIPGGISGPHELKFDNSSCNQSTIQLHSLNDYANATSGSNLLEARIPASVTIPTPNNGTTTSDYYTVEYREKAGWDRGIPNDSVLVHLHGQDGYSYWEDSAGHQGALYPGDEYVDASNNTYIAVNSKDASTHTATVTLGGCKINADLTYSGDTSGEFNDQVTLAADLTVHGSGATVPNAALTLTLGSQSCPATTDASGHASCTVTINQDPGSYTAGANYAGDPAYNAASGSNSFTISQEESSLSYTGPLTSHYHDPFTAYATLVDPEDGNAPIAGKTVVFTLGVGDTCSAKTDATGTASCPITPNQTGPQNLVASFAGDTDYLASSDTKSFSITPEETTLTYTGPTVILASASGATLTATMVEDGSNDNDSDGGSPAPNPSETVTLSIGSQSCTGTTDPITGNVQCTIPSITMPLGPEKVGASFTGDSYYQPSSDSKTAIVFAFPSRGAFTLGDQTVVAAGASTVTWWADNWWQLNSLSGGSAPAAFKGFAGTVTTLPTTTPANVCGTTWTTSSGNSPPPVNGVPTYMGVLVTNSVTRAGSTISGNYDHIVVVQVKPGYTPDPSNHGTGTIVTTFC
jgi:hypothetical protein